MKFLVDGSAVRLAERVAIWGEGIAGQLLTPLTNYRLCAETFAIDNGAYSGFRELAFFRLLARVAHKKSSCLFVAAPDKVGDYLATLSMWHRYRSELTDWPCAFVAQEGYEGMPDDAHALFTCDGSGFSRYDHMVVRIRDAVNAQ